MTNSKPHEVPVGTRAPNTDGALLEVRGLRKCYPGTTLAVLDALRLDINRGEIVAVIGRSGSGKSTLLNLVGQMDSADAGTIRFAGQDTTGWDDDTRTRFRRSHLGFVFQAYNLIPTLTVAENVCMPLELNGHDNFARAEALLQRLGIARLAERYPDELSGGEQQRTAIARALVHEPDLIVADEPTGNLDADTAAEVITAMEVEARDAGTAVLMATHSVEMTGRADRVLSLNHGSLETAST